MANDHLAVGYPYTPSVIPGQSMFFAFCRLAVLATVALNSMAMAADWPMWRFDAGRSASSPHPLPTGLKLQWSLSLPPLTPAWPDQPLIPFDAAYEPIVAGTTMFVGSSRDDCVSAYDTRTGSLKWRFLVDGPVRFAPCFASGKLYFGSDDGHLYCLDADKGTELWRFRGGPDDRRVLGNNRLVSMWPSRGAPVVADGVVYFAASIWPFMGIFIHALDAETGKVIWTNDGDGSAYTKQPHSADAFAGVAPQGPLSIAGDLLFIPGGRSVPAAYDRKTGKLRHYLLNDNSKKGGGHTVTIAGDLFFNGPGVFRVDSGKYVGECSPLVVGMPLGVLAYRSGEVRSFDTSNALAELKDSKAKWKPDPIGAEKVPGVTCLIRAGNHAYAGTIGKVIALDLPFPEDPPTRPQFDWEAPVSGTPLSLVAADNRLFVSTTEGKIYCFGPGASPVPLPPTTRSEPRKPIPPIRTDVTRGAEGYAVIWRANADEIESIVRSSKLHVIAIEADPIRARVARERLSELRLYGERCCVHVGVPGKVALPPYLSTVMLAADLQVDALPRVYASIRPYGGKLALPPRTGGWNELREAASRLPQAVVTENAQGLTIERGGAIPGSADWTHEHADAANTRVSKDSVVRAPLGVLWFGGTSHEGILPRHGHGPQPQVVGGRILIEGMDMLRAVDVYTGRLLWEATLPGVGAFYNNTAHQPGANSRGTNYISLPDAIYVIYKAGCVVLDPATGRTVREIQLPKIGPVDVPIWGHLNVVGDYLIAAADPVIAKAAEKQAKSPSKLFRMTDDSYSASRYLAVLDRHTGKMLWTAPARYGFRHNSICSGNGRLYAIDRLSGIRESKLKDTGEPLPLPCVVAFDLKTGKQLWTDETETFGTWLSYSEKFDVLVEAGRVARDTLSDEPKGMRAYRGIDGKELWFDKVAAGPAMIHGDTILRGQGACELQTGKAKMRRDPITGQEEEWTWVRNYGCNTPMASEHLLTFRSGAAGFYDLCEECGTGNFGGFRSSCTNNLIVANGVLSAPDYTRTCTCSYQNQTSIALVPMADVEQWTFYGKSEVKKIVKRVGINFGAPGDRRSPDGSLWLDFPSVGGASPAVPVTVTGSKARYFRRHQSVIDGEIPWVSASGVENVESITLKLLPTEMEDRNYTVRLIFAEPENVTIGDRRFDVSVQGRKALDDFDPFKEAGASRRTVIKEVRGVRVDDELRIGFRAVSKRGAIICGIEVIAE